MSQMLRHHFRILQRPIQVKIFTAASNVAFRSRTIDIAAVRTASEFRTLPLTQERRIDYKYRHHPPIQPFFFPPSTISSDQYFISSYIRYFHRHINSTPSRTLHTIFTMIGFFSLMAVPALFLGAIAAPVKAPEAALVEKPEAAHDMTPYSTESENNTSITTINNNVQNITIIINNINNNINNNGVDANDNDLEGLLQELVDLINNILTDVDNTLGTVSDLVDRLLVQVQNLVGSLSDLLTNLGVPGLLAGLDLGNLLGGTSGSGSTSIGGILSSLGLGL
ncbi:hypothetical protein LTR27_012402 [Elasticomyces elasticus]|nr:hypothetical protein LTR27_012402 [Elasticomyces elasticus]